MKYIVRKKLSPQAAAGVGEEGASGTVVFTETPSKAREIGAERLGVRPGDVTVEATDDTTQGVFGVDRPLTKEEAAAIWEQETSVVPGSWESA